jgi:predicted Fe-Mo cluster-binding NifX family protein
MKKVLLTVDGNDIAPRFDLAPEVLVISLSSDPSLEETKTVVLPRPSAEMVCHVATAENVQAVICGGIEEEYLQYFSWKRIELIHSVIGPAEHAVENFRKGTLKSGDILFEKRKASVT